jgi:predicted MFS family arabinose efflux permease
LIHGLNFALYWSASIDAIHKLAPKDLRTICIAVLNVSYHTFGGALGNLIWGIVYDYHGVVNVYKYAAFLMIGIVVLLKYQEDAFHGSLRSNKDSDLSSIDI